MGFWQSFKHWFNHKGYPNSRLRKHDFAIHILLLIVGIVFSLIIYKNIDLLNKYSLAFIRLGSVLLIIGTIFALRYLYLILKNVKFGVRGMRNGVKIIAATLLVLLLINVYINQEEYVPKVTNNVDQINFSNYNPFLTGSAVLEDSNKSSSKKSWVETVFPSTEPVSDKTKEVEQAILRYTNVQRVNNNLNVLKWDEDLAKIARDHSLDQAENNYFSHTDLTGGDPTDRAVKAGYNVHKELGGGWYSDGIAENIGKMPTGDVVGVGYVSSDPDSIAKAQVDSWMRSPGHRANILNGEYIVLGVGVAYDGLYYVSTQNFK